MAPDRLLDEAAAAMFPGLRGSCSAVPKGLTSRTPLRSVWWRCIGVAFWLLCWLLRAHLTPMFVKSQ